LIRDQIVEQIIRYIDAHISEDITSSDLSKAFGYSRRHIYNIFQSSYPMPLMEYVRWRKIQSAANEMRALRSEKSLYDIALDYGYTTPAGFYKAFQSIFGCSPSDYKKRSVHMMKNEMRSIEALYEVVVQDPNNAQAYYELSEQYLMKALELSPQTQSAPRTYTALANVYRDNQDYEKAEALYSKAIALDVANSEYYRDRAAIYCAMQQTDNAITDYEKALALDPDNTWNYWELAEYYQNLKLHQKALDVYLKMAAVMPDFAWAHQDVGRIYHVDFKNYVKARDSYSKAVELEPRNIIFWYNFAFFYEEFEEYEKAIDVYTKIISIVPNDAWGYRGRASIYEKLNIQDKAAEDYAKATMQNSQHDTMQAYYQYIFDNRWNQTCW